MANLKNITELPMAESAEGLNLIVNDNGSVKQIVASEVGAQADWNEMNENSASYIKNKPFWGSEIIETTLIDQLTLNFTNTGFYGQQTTDPIEIIENENYVVTFDGVQYNCVAFFHNYGNHASIGNEANMNGPAYDIPFFITINSGRTIIFANSIGEHTISVVKRHQDIQKIDEKYLPKQVFMNVITEINPSNTPTQWDSITNPVNVIDARISPRTMYRDYGIAMYDNQLMLPNENFAYIVDIGEINVNTLAKGESVMETGWENLRKAHITSDVSIIRGCIRYFGSCISFYIAPRSKTTVITSSGMVYEISSNEQDLYDDANWSVSITVTYMGSVELI